MWQRNLGCEHSYERLRMRLMRPRIEVITGVERRCRWTWEQKRAIVEEKLVAACLCRRDCASA